LMCDDIYVYVCVCVCVCVCMCTTDRSLHKESVPRGTNSLSPHAIGAVPVGIPTRMLDVCVPLWVGGWMRCVSVLQVCLISTGCRKLRKWYSLVRSFLSVEMSTRLYWIFEINNNIIMLSFVQIVTLELLKYYNNIIIIIIKFFTL